MRSAPHIQYSPSHRTRFPVIALLACQQYLAIALIYAAVPVVLRANGASLELVGLFSTVFFAFTVNFLWAPVVDRYSLGHFGLRRSWIMATQVGTALTMAVMAMLDPAADFLPLFVVSVAVAALAATQRIATLGYVAEVLRPAERPFGSALFGWGAAVGNAVGGAAFLQLIGVLGWRLALLGFALMLLAFASCILMVPEPQGTRAVDAAASTCAAPLRVLLGVRLWAVAAMISPGVFGLAVAFAMVSPRLVDLGVTAPDVGLVAALANIATFTVIAPLTGLLVSRTSPRRGVVWACAVLALAFLVLSDADRLLGPLGGAVAAVCFVFGALAIQHVAFTTWFLALARPGEAATDVTLLTAVMAALALAGFAASGFIAAHFGYGTTLLLAATGYALTTLLVAAIPALKAERRANPLESDLVR